MHILFFILFAVLAGSVQAQEQWPACHIEPWSVGGPGGSPTADTLMRVRSGFGCRLTANDFVEFKLDVPPQNGTVTIDGRRATYTPRPGFTGTDRFSLGRLATGVRQQLHVRVEVR